jgi:CubicO group peptidase (beta-lactamase class C family)
MSNPLRFTLAAACASALWLAGTAALAAQAPARPATLGSRAGAADLADFDAYVEAVRARFQVPGIAVAIVKDGKIVLERGYGVRELGKPEPVDAHTLFAIASNTKAFTAASLAMLADDGKLELTDRVVDHLPWFRMSDPYITREMRVRDLLAHRSGLSLGAGDLLYWPTTDYSTEEVARRLRDVPISGGFREQYAYDNILFGVAQLVVEQASGMPFQRFLQTRIWAPLGMDETRYNSDHLLPGDRNIATGHALADFKDLQPVARTAWDNLSGAGGIYSSVHDLSKWVRVQLAGGVIAGEGEGARRLFSKKRQDAMWSILTPIPVREAPVPELAAATPNYAGYGQGWSLSDYRGRKLVWHTGGWPGMVSRITLVPSEHLGVIVLTSAESGYAFNAVTYRALDALLAAPATDWLAAYDAARAKSEGKADQTAQEQLKSRDAKSGPSLPLARYAGRFRDPWYGDVLVEQAGAGLRLRFAHTAQLVGSLSHWQQDTFVVRWDDRSLNADAFLTYSLKPDGTIRELRMEPMSPLTDFSFDFQDLRLAPVPPPATP